MGFLKIGRMFRGFFGKTIGFVGYTIQYGCIAHCAFEYIGEFVSCSGPSMEPTITNHDVVFSERVSRHLCRIQKYQEAMCGWKAITFGIPQIPEAMAQFPMP
ncbi:mitochondrial inner membrane protease subunit 1 [Labeo rohita]|uniref:Mitochondrial inner membrane protease subunit 1 n=1 Tax=Labeo rohita TaxID=84645 RepID=A0A498L7X5_LABRO|nr:mitochondrial inner membrane protease subunit 1 [Labeo rohita]RXN38556.1 mitochondrial inner membrane protease subunit 1 [Labeo rohita]